ncbi:outer membrane protein assembly factor BamB family protein [Streptomyces triticagri]|nr:PQQ-binding-like beta-propeller repeat protein [Streptomyces triticagri]
MGFTRGRARAATAVGVLCALLASGACTGGGGGDDGKDERRSAVKPAKLKKAWQVSARARVATPDDEGDVWVSDGILALRTDGSVTGYDTRSGKKRWTMEMPEGTKGICGFSAKPSPSGLGGLFFTAEKPAGKKAKEKQEKSDCSYAGAVDLADGKVKWTQHVGTMKGTYGKNDISIGDEAVTVTLDCYGVKQFRAEDGKPLGTRVESDKACAHNVDHNGRHLAVRTAPAGDAKEVVPGWMPAADGAPAHFMLYEGGDKKPLWRTKAARVGDELHRIVSDDPLVLDITREGHRLIQTYDGDGKPVRTIGKRLKRFSGGDGEAQVGPFTHGDTLVMGYGRDPALYAYDLDTGKVRWKKRRGGEQILGVWKDKLLAARQMKGPKGVPEVWLLTYGMQDGKQRTIGRVTEAGVQPQLFAAWDDERIFLSGTGAGRTGERVVAYPLPASGGDTRRYDGEPMPDGSELTPAQKRAWRKGDLRPDAVANACEAVSPAAQKSMRVYRKGMPPPADCAWEEKNTPRHAERELSVTVTAHRPGGDEEFRAGSSSDGARKPTPALAVAEQAFREAGTGKIENEDDSEKVLADAHRLEGLGDEAKSTAFGSAADSVSTADILARYRNVTVRVKARTEALSSYLWADVPPQHRVEAAARQAAADVLEQLGAEVPAAGDDPARAAGGKITKAKSLCTRLRSEAAGLVPGAEAQDTAPKGGSDGRVAGCEWEADADLSPSLIVRVKAMPDSPLTGEDALEQAEGEITAAKGGELKGFGDEARLYRRDFRHKDEMTRTHTVVARKDNLVVRVEYQRWHHPDKARMDADAERVARRVLDAY